ncbi:MAG: YbfB/YjiJ family MFS transporter [Undibacterium sp.]|nr:YbfB/YjiJ family MFS transporter [Undibacterium sp.]
MTTTTLPATSTRLTLALFALSGTLSLMLAMGIGRFAYTALLPQMRDASLLSHADAALLAAGNYLGYLIGALWAAFSRQANPVRRLSAGLLMSVLTTLAMGFELGFALWFAVRCIAGIASALVYVYATGIVLRRLMAAGTPGWSMLHYMGVGAGITLSALVAQATLQMNVAQGWWWLGAIAGVAAIAAAGLLPAGRTAVTASEMAQHETSKTEIGLPLWLAASYGLAGFGYIINMTFLPVMLRGGAATNHAGITGWLIVGIAAMPATALWVRLALRYGTYSTLIACTLVQAIGVALPVLLPGLTSAYVGAALLGGTFMGIAGLAQWLARLPDPQATARRIGFITAFYGVGQIAGPLLVAWVDRGNDFTLPVLLAAAALLLSALLLEVSRRVENLG